MTDSDGGILNEDNEGILTGPSVRGGGDGGGSPDPEEPTERFWVIVFDKQSSLPPRVREVEAVRMSPNSEHWMCRAVSGDTHTWHSFHRDVLYDDPEIAEVEAAEAILLGELAHR